MISLGEDVETTLDYVSSGFSLEDESVESLSFFHGYMLRDDAEKLCHSEGMFLVRRVVFEKAIHIAIVVRHRGKIEHLLIRHTQGYFGSQVYYVYTTALDSIVQLIQHHIGRMTPISRTGAQLLVPVLRPNWQVHPKQVASGQFLGRGQFGSVTKGRIYRSVFDVANEVAIKRMSDLEISMQARSEFLREANTMIPLRHKNVIRLMGICSVVDPMQIMMEMAPNGALESHVKNASPQPDKLSKLLWVWTAACGLAYLEQQKILHRDVALRNCLLGPNDEVKIADFGLAILCARGKLKDTNMNKVPFRFYAPEVLKGGNWTMSSDVWSYACLLHELFTCGHVPHSQSGPVELRNLAKAAQLRVVLPPTGENEDEHGKAYVVDAPPEVLDLVDRCTRHEPSERPSFKAIASETRVFYRQEYKATGHELTWQERILDVFGR